MPLPSTPLQGAPVATPLATERVTLKPSPDFLWGFQPGSFDLFEVPSGKVGDLECPGGFFWLPTPVRIARKAGANGVRTPDRGEPESAAWRATLADWSELRSGQVIAPTDPIPTECLPVGVYPGGYVRRYESEWRGQPGQTHLSPWDLVEPIPGAPARVKFDRAHYALWLWWLVATERIPAVHPSYVDAKKSATKERIQTASVQPFPSESIRDSRIAPLKAQAETEESAKIAEPVKEGRRRGR